MLDQLDASKEFFQFNASTAFISISLLLFVGKSSDVANLRERNT